MQVEAKQYGRGKERKSISTEVGKLTIVASSADDAKALAEFAALLLDGPGPYKDLLRELTRRAKEES